MNDSAAEVVAACQQGDRDAQRQLYELFHRKIFRMTVRMVGLDNAPDLTQQVFLRAFQTIGQFTGRARFETWLYRVAVNECLQHIRRAGKVACQTLYQEPAGREPAHTTQLEQRDLLSAALGRLEPGLRFIFLLREVEGLSYEEIAETLHLSEGTVASRLNRARRRLKKHLLDLGWEP